jgi:hypothetical protein
MRDRAISANYATSSPSRPPDVVLVPSKVNVRSADPILPLKIQNSNAFNGFFAVVGCFRALLSRTTSGVLSCAPRTRTHAGCGSYHRHIPQTAPPRPIWPQTCIGVSAAAAAACMSASGRVWWWAVSRSRTPTTRCRAGAYATIITPGVCWRALDVRGRGCAGDGLLQRRDDRRKRTHERKAGPAE